MQHDLETRGFKKLWFPDPKESDKPDLRLTVLVCYVKLRSMYLRGFVEEEHSSFPGALQFKSSYSRALKAVLTRRADFTDPEASDDAWSSREKRSIASLHFKKFSRAPFVQAHLDYYGLRALLFRMAPVAWARSRNHRLCRSSVACHQQAPSSLRACDSEPFARLGPQSETVVRASNSAWVFPPLQAGQALAHAFTPKSFTDVFRLRQALLEQGWDRAPLIGVAAARCQP